MKRYRITAAVVALVMLAGFWLARPLWQNMPFKGVLKVGFLFEHDESTPYTYNFSLAEDALALQYGERVQVLTRSNVLRDETGNALVELVRRGCGIIFVCTDSDQPARIAAEHPQVQFCQLATPAALPQERPRNYHTFNAKMWQARYLSGVAAGMRLQELLEAGRITEDQALVGFVASSLTPGNLSGAAAYLLGARSVAPQALLKVAVTGAWCSYTQDKAAAAALIDAGCLVITANTHTTGTAVACEAAAVAGKPVAVIGYSRSTLDIAPTATLLSVRVNWAPYITGAVGALLDGKAIEAAVQADAHGTDLCAGLDQGWVQLMEINPLAAAAGTGDALSRLSESLRRGSLEVFRGPYTATDPANPQDTIDLRNGFTENRDSSIPSFHYLLDGLAEVI